ncbi:MAG: nucleotidyltransferase family protein, partial [Candidatus Bathyarchaeota archaeon]
LISLIVLAAGKSTRFGENKLLYKLGDRTVIERVVESALGSQADEVFLVLGYEAERLKRKVSGTGCRFIYNRNFEEGQSSSIKTGLASVARNSKAVLIMPGDIASISSQSIDKVIEEYRRTRDPILVAAHRGKLGHPILFDKSLFHEIAQINEETQGLKAIVKKYRTQINKVEVGSKEVLLDLDARDDLDKFSRSSTF